VRMHYSTLLLLFTPLLYYNTIANIAPKWGVHVCYSVKVTMPMDHAGSRFRSQSVVFRHQPWTEKSLIFAR
jgi:hypothetical protein